MHNCVYTRLKSIVSSKSLIYQITYKNKYYCLEVNTSNKDKLSILELKARFNNEALEELFKLIKNNLNHYQ